MNYWQFKQKQSLPLSAKVNISLGLIREWITHWNSWVYVSFSGGKDSTVLLDLVRKVDNKVPAVFINTGLEYPEVVKFVSTVSNVIYLKPKLTFKQVIESQGYPIISKDQAHKIDRIRRKQNKNIRRMYLDGIMKNGSQTRCVLSKRWRYLLEAPFKISAECCLIMKRNPVREFEIETGLRPFIGTLANESQIRLRFYLRDGCNAFNKKRPTSQPLSFWTDDNIWEYIKQNKLTYSSIYVNGMPRTGCMFCLFGQHLSPVSRFDYLQKNHPKIYSYLMNELGYKEVLNWYPERKVT